MAELVVTGSWKDRLRADEERARRVQSPAEREVTREVVRRAIEAGALAVALTGSTVRGQRTPISDIDFHVVGNSPDLRRLPAKVDVVVDTPERFARRLAEGDDFVQWTLREGCVLHDPHGILREAEERIVSEALWPDATRKLTHADELAHLARRVLEIGDRDAAQEHLRATLTSLARGLLLAEGTFPLSRAELPFQLRTAGHHNLAGWLDRTIHQRLSLNELHQGLDAAGEARHPVVPTS